MRVNMNECKLICLPFAGGSSLIFSDWKNAFASHVKVIPVELNGRGQLSNESFYKSAKDAAEDILQRYDQDLKEDIPFCFFGQSVGGLIVFEIIQILHKEKRDLPFHIFFSGIFPPHIKKIQNKLHQLSDDIFIKQMKQWSVLPKLLADDEELLKTWIPILKSDYQLLENFHFKPLAFDLPVDITILKGKDDNWYSREEYQEWSRYSDRKIQFYEIDGGHHFINQQKKEVLSIINSTISAYF